MVPHRVIILQERMATLFGFVAAVGGTIGTYLSSLGERIVTGADGHALYGAIDPNAVSSWTLVAVNAMTALAGGACLAFTQVRKTRREQQAADDVAFKDTWEAKLKAVKDESDDKIGKLEATLSLANQRFQVLSQKLAVVKGQRNFLREKLDAIAKQNEKQSRKQKEIAANVMEIGKAVNAPVSSDGEGTTPDMPTVQPDPPAAKP